MFTQPTMLMITTMTMINKIKWDKRKNEHLYVCHNKHKCVSSFSSAGRAWDWRSWGRWFKPGREHFYIKTNKKRKRKQTITKNDDRTKKRRREYLYFIQGRRRRRRRRRITIITTITIRRERCYERRDSIFASIILPT